MTVSFPDALDVRILDDTWRELLAPFGVVVKEVGQPDVTFVVPVGFKTDFASVPRLPIVYEKFGNTGDKPATGHDYLYTIADRSREWCDAVFHHGLLAIGMDEVSAQLMYDGVRLGGESHFGNKSANSPNR